MGVQASGATLEIQLVADVARLKSDMAQMQAVVQSATGSVNQSLGAMAKGSGAAATAMAASAQQTASAAMGMAGAYGAAGQKVRLTSREVIESVSLVREAAMGNFNRLAGTMTMLSTRIAVTGGGFRAFATELLEMAGILKVTQDAELAEAAANAAAQAQNIRAVADRAAANVLARQTQAALAQAEIEAATTAEAEAAAQGRLVKAMRASEVATGRLAIAQDALATASAAASEKGAASAAATFTGLTKFGGLLVGIGIAAATVYTAFKLFQDQAREKVDKLVDKLKEHYEKTLEQEEADREWSQSLDGVAESMAKLAGEIEKTFTTDALKHVEEQTDAMRKLADATKAAADAAAQKKSAEQTVMTPQVGIGQGASAMPTGDIDAANKKAAEARRAIEQTKRAVNDLEIASAVERGKVMADATGASEKFVEDMLALLEQRARLEDTAGKAIFGSLTPDTAALESLKKAFGEAAAAGDVMASSAATTRAQMTQLVAELIHGTVAPAKFASTIRDMAKALSDAAKEAKKDPFAIFESRINGAEGSGPNRMGGRAEGFGQFEPNTWLSLFDKVYPQFAALNDKAKLAMRDQETIAKGVIDAYAHENAKFLQGFGATITAANLYLAHWFGGAGAKALLQSSPNTSAESALATVMKPKLLAEVVGKNRIGGMTVGEVEAIAAKKMGDSSAPISAGVAALDQWQKALKQASAEMDVAVNGQLRLAGAYLEGDAAAIKAEAAQKAEEMALQKHADAGTAAVFQEKELQKAVATGAAEAARSIAKMRDETAARTMANDNVAAGAISYRKLGQAMQDQTALAPLLARQTIATGDTYAKITAEIAAYRKALHDAHAEEDRSEALTRLGEMNEQYAQSAVLLRAEAQLVAVNKDKRDEILSLLQKELELRAQFPGMTEAEIQKVIVEQAAEDGLRRKLNQTEAAFDALRQTGENMIDTVFNVDNWKKPLDIALQLVKQLEQSFVTLAFANPLKNKLFGENLPTLDNVGGVGGFFKGVVGAGGKGAASGVASLSAAGTTLSTAGATLGTAGTALTTAAAALQAAASALATAGAAGGAGGGAGGLGGLLGLLGGGGSGVVSGAGDLTAGMTSDFTAGLGAISDLPGLAGGGWRDIGGYGGTDNNLLSLNGIPIAAVSSDERLAILPRARPQAPANSNAPSGDHYHVHVTVAGGGDPIQNRQTGEQWGRGIAEGIGRNRRKGMI